MHGPNVRDSLLEIVRNLVEEVDFCEGLVFFQSLAGGTGSGLGSYLMNVLNDEFPDLAKLNVCVAPHLTGEVILQSYNCVLTIASLY